MEKVGREQTEISDTPHAYSWNKILVGGQTDRTSRGRDVQDFASRIADRGIAADTLRRGRRGWSRSDVHYDRRRIVVRNDHWPEYTAVVRLFDVAQLVLGAITL